MVLRKWSWAALLFVFGGKAFGHENIYVMQDYIKASHIANSYEKPILLVFTGSDWSDSSKKLLDEVIYTPEFSLRLGNELVMVKVDYPEKKALPVSILVQNEILREKFHIKEFPALVVIDGKEKEIFRMRYMEKDAVEYATLLKEHLFSYTQVKKEAEKAILQKNVTAMEKVYLSAVDQEYPEIQELLIDEGIKQAKGVLLPLEAYTRHVKENTHDSPKAKKLREMIMERDLQNEKGARLRLALLDFQAGDNISKEALQLLSSHIDSFDKKDLEQLFRLHLIISECFEEKKGVLVDDASSQIQDKVAIEERLPLFK